MVAICSISIPCIVTGYNLMHVNISCSSDDAAVLMWIINPI